MRATDDDDTIKIISIADGRDVVDDLVSNPISFSPSLRITVTNCQLRPMIECVVLIIALTDECTLTCVTSSNRFVSYEELSRRVKRCPVLTLHRDIKQFMRTHENANVAFVCRA